MASHDSEPPDGWRFYRVARVRPILWAYSVFMTAMFVAVIASSASDRGSSVALTVGLTVMWVGVIAGLVWIGCRNGLAESAVGLCAQSLRRREVAWEDISAFDVPDRQPFGWTAVYARRHSGRRVNLVVMQGKRIVWRDGETMDIASVLAARLGEWRDTQHEAR